MTDSAYISGKQARKRIHTGLSPNRPLKQLSAPAGGVPAVSARMLGVIRRSHHGSCNQLFA